MIFAMSKYHTTLKTNNVRKLAHSAKQFNGVEFPIRTGPVWEEQSKPHCERSPVRWRMDVYRLDDQALKLKVR